MFSAIKHNSTILFLAQTLYTLLKRILLRSTLLRFLSARVNIGQIPMSISNWLVNSSSNFASFFIVTMHNSPLSFKLIHFRLCIKESNESPDFESFVSSGENLTNSSCHSPNHKSVFLQILHHLIASWNIAPLYFFTSNIIYFG